MDSTHATKLNALLDAKCRETIETSYPLFTIHTNHVSTIPEETIFHLCRCIFASALQKLPVSNQDSITFLCLRRILSAIFDADHRAFVLDDAEADPRVLATLTPDAKACVFAQAIAGIVFFLRKVATCSATLSPEVFEAKLQRFAASEERTRMLRAIEKSPVWTNCFEKANIGNMIMDAVKGKAIAGADVVAPPLPTKKEGGSVSHPIVSVTQVVEGDDEIMSKQLWDDGHQIKRNFGVPDVFTVMVLN
ncbi:hypothetical protein VMCG_09165 [Cytospora schulzeri]|uniref:Uncharacterized protein n=1 Tax=Cytospora schulzeri TaxID=448051 RepID=A0A423VLE7_9PEZI|nr:hypothetical protein VMCG_09165 [Valsa malicola]